MNNKFWTPDMEKNTGNVCGLLLEKTGKIVFCKYSDVDVEWENGQITGAAVVCNIPENIDCLMKEIYGELR